jgi:hypothetical protein
MYQQFLDQAGTLFKPLEELVTLNQSAFETLASKQSALVSEIFNDSIAFTQKILAEKDGNYWELHKTYWEGVSQKLNQATQDTADFFSATQAKMGDMLQESALGSALVEVTKNMPSVEAAVASALKPMETAKIKPSVESAKVPAAKPPQVPALVAKSAESKASGKAQPSKTATKAAPKPVTKPAQTKAVAAKPVAKQSESAKATGKKVGGDDASVESAIRSIMSDRTTN